jgi:hypothetical protein
MQVNIPERQPNASGLLQQPAIDHLALIQCNAKKNRRIAAAFRLLHVPNKACQQGHELQQLAECIA